MHLGLIESITQLLTETLNAITRVTNAFIALIPLMLVCIIISVPYAIVVNRFKNHLNKRGKQNGTRNH